ncbi:hypothetical protein CU098_006526 [Rhizopus stolonifer]|uniref:BZIP domain-containing protein n=1 Tax=Rhizopus stolonifer TaxID=4846 RepID=A0A367KR34_RHIST|nr:hypothetical protein CU098_006526 [Rhizopus stolonifer]
MNSSNTDTLNFDSLDDWLESDLRQSGIILPQDNNKPTFSPVMPPTPAQMMLASPPISECTPRMDPLLDLSTPLLKYEPLSPVETPKAELQDISNSAVDLQPFIKALTLLGSLQQNNTSNHNTISNKRPRNDSIDEQQDLIALKRQRNTDAARRSRQRKAMKMDALEKRVMDLEAENERLRLRAAVAESERANVEAKEKRSRVKILELERQLADTHKALLKYNTKDITLLPATPTISTSAI